LVGEKSHLAVEIFEEEHPNKTRKR
jgi:hypothetical protein